MPPHHVHHPIGRYCFRKLTFGISSAPELFQKRMSRVLEGLPGVVCLMDDVFIFGANQGKHDKRLTAAMERLEAAGVTLNSARPPSSFWDTSLTGVASERIQIRPQQ